jgi:hypothetical protein
VHAFADTEVVSIRTRQQNGLCADIGRPDLRIRRGEGERDSDRARAGADVGDSCRGVADPLGREPDELLAGCARRHHPAGRS